MYVFQVVPLSQRSGILEWCENTEPLGDYLNNAHKHYHPTDWTPSYCRQQMKVCHTYYRLNIEFINMCYCSYYRVWLVQNLQMINITYTKISVQILDRYSTCSLYHLSLNRPCGTSAAGRTCRVSPPPVWWGTFLDSATDMCRTYLLINVLLKLYTLISVIFLLC